MCQNLQFKEAGPEVWPHRRQRLMIVCGKLVIRDDSGQARRTMRIWLWVDLESEIGVGGSDVKE